jgi:hypothetical protein
MGVKLPSRAQTLYEGRKIKFNETVRDEIRRRTQPRASMLVNILMCIRRAHWHQRGGIRAFCPVRLSTTAAIVVLVFNIDKVGWSGEQVGLIYDQAKQVTARDPWDSD